jgi:hypothetical protein
MGLVRRSEVRGLTLGEEYTVTLTLLDPDNQQKEEETATFDFIACE